MHDMHDPDSPLMPAQLPPLSDASVIEILEFLHELVCRFESCYFAQIHRFYQQQREHANQSPLAPPEEDLPF